MGDSALRKDAKEVHFHVSTATGCTKCSRFYKRRKPVRAKLARGYEGSNQIRGQRPGALYRQVKTAA
jgi:hypothetical protein